MSNRLFELFKRSSIPGFSNFFAAKSLVRRLLWAIVIFIFIYLTSHSLLEIIGEYIQVSLGAFYSLTSTRPFAISLLSPTSTSRPKNRC